MILRRAAATVVILSTTLAGCSASNPPSLSEAAKPSAVGTPPTLDNATRASPVVAARPARVYVMTSVDAACRSLEAPEITITRPPTKGDVSFKPGQQTTLAATAKGTCIGRTATGTGIYYTARAGHTGIDQFAIEARAATGEVATRVFEVKISE
ncbi:MAG: hypothetical protein ABL893_12000 [Hyphomicrobium sp.]